MDKRILLICIIVALAFIVLSGMLISMNQEYNRLERRIRNHYMVVDECAVTTQMAEMFLISCISIEIRGENYTICKQKNDVS